MRARQRDRAARHLDYRDVDAGAPERGRRWVATFPGDMVSIHRIDLPPAIRGTERLKAAEIQLSERVAEAPDALAFLPVRATPRDRDWVHVAVADRSALQKVRAGCAPGGLALLPDFLALPFAERCAVLDTGGQDGMVRLRVGADFGCTAEAPVVIEVLRTLAEAKVLDSIWIGPGIAPDLAGQSGQFGLAPADPDALSFPDEALVRAQDMGARLSGAAEDMGPWLWRNRTAIAALYATLLLAGAGLILRAGDVEAEAQARQTRATELAREVFLPAGPILDLRQQVMQAIAAAESDGAGSGRETFTAGLARMSGRLAAAEGAVSRIAWGVRDGYVVDVTTDSFASVQTLANALATAGFAVTVASSRVLEAGRVGATLRLAQTDGPK